MPPFTNHHANICVTLAAYKTRDPTGSQTSVLHLGCQTPQDSGGDPSFLKRQEGTVATINN